MIHLIKNDIIYNIDTEIEPNVIDIIMDRKTNG